MWLYLHFFAIVRVGVGKVNRGWQGNVPRVQVAMDEALVMEVIQGVQDTLN